MRSSRNEPRPPTRCTTTPSLAARAPPAPNQQLCLIADVGVVEGGALLDRHRLRPVTDRGELRPDTEVVQRAGRGQLRGGDPPDGTVQDDDRDVLWVVLRLGVVGVGMP